jgi:hypothetical protein
MYACVANNSHSTAQFRLGEVAALLIDPDNGEEHRTIVGFIQWFASRPASGAVW